MTRGAELMANACKPIMGLTEIHALSTLDHPHLRSYSMTIDNNNGNVHPAPPMPNGASNPPLITSSVAPRAARPARATPWTSPPTRCAPAAST